MISKNNTALPAPRSPLYLFLGLIMAWALLMALTAPLRAEEMAPGPQHQYIAWPVRALPLPGYLTATAKDCLMLNVRLQKPGETFRLRVWLTVRRPDGTEATYERRVDVLPTDIWVTAVFGGYEAAEAGILESVRTAVWFKEEAEPPAIAASGGPIAQ